MALKVIVCGEGSTDVGTREYGSDAWINGPAIPYIHNASPIGLSIMGISSKELECQVPVLRRNPPKGFGVKAYRLSAYAKRNGYDVAICYVDCDKYKDIDLFPIRHQEIDNGFTIADTGVIGIPMIPKRMMESWLLADEKAYQTLFDKIPDNPRLPRKPEELRGDKHNPDSDYPKHYLARVLTQFNESGTDWFYDIASNSDIETLRQKCPESYETFYKDINSKLLCDSE